ncbi:DUF3108 domain-containing protein [Hydromonas duriensis]|uniref:Uncharacterized protein DUF3108 n=1 Tax=Hydromonas duriensis TaxID=1527608 RepID=A0A4R6YBU5_9BURK|nr:DUF3108 domain-containing protein [Hydromonas duriensis]TDR33038.1 uncharacterized protein DUF3108 [Hydromonas duriensis]
MPLIIPLKRSAKNVLFSGAVHGALLLSLWFATSDLRTPDVKPPDVIDATILPAPATEKTPIEHTAEVTRLNTSAQVQAKNSASHDNKTTSSGTENKQPTPPNGSNITAANGTAASADQIQAASSDEGNTAGGNGGGNKPLTNGTPVAVKPIGGFQIQYDAHVNKGNIEADGGATLTFNRNKGNYTAELVAHASFGKFSAHSEGELRENTLATTSFKDGRAIKFLGMGSEHTGSNFKVDYAAKEINFTGSGGTQPLTYTAVYDYLSAIAYLQALLQQHPEQARAGNSLQLPIGKRTVIEMATVTFKPVDRLSTQEGAFEATPASIKIPSGSIQSIDVWFVPDKNYRPLQIELGFVSGKVKLVSRKSS